MPDQSGEHLFSEVAAYSNRCRRPERLEDFGQGMQCCQLLHSWGTLSLVLRQEEDSCWGHVLRSLERLTASLAPTTLK